MLEKPLWQRSPAGGVFYRADKGIISDLYTADEGENRFRARPNHLQQTDWNRRAGICEPAAHSKTGQVHTTWQRESEHSVEAVFNCSQYAQNPPVRSGIRWRISSQSKTGDVQLANNAQRLIGQAQ